MAEPDRAYTSVEICAGAGGQAIGLHEAGFDHSALIEIDHDACRTLRDNVHRIGCDESIVHEINLKLFSKNNPPNEHDQFTIEDLKLKTGQVDLLAGGVPCPPFSFAGRQLGEADERDLFPVMLDMVEALEPKAVLIENVRGLLEPEHRFAPYRTRIVQRLEDLGYTKCAWEVLEAQDFGVPQLRPRAVLVALKHKYAPHFQGMPKGDPYHPLTARKALDESMTERYTALFGTEFDEQARVCLGKWREHKRGIDTVAPTLVGGSKKHGGADLGPTRAKKAWAALGVNAMGVADSDPATNPERHLLRPEGPMLTVEQAAIIQGFPAYWRLSGRKTAAYRQVGNAFPPPVAMEVGLRIRQALEACDNGDTTAELLPVRRGSVQPSLFTAG